MKTGLLWMVMAWFTPTAEEFLTQINLIKASYPRVLVIAMLYNTETHKNLAIPSRAGNVRTVEVPISSIRDVSQSLVHGLLKKGSVQAVYLIDDGQKLITNGKTLKYIHKLSKKHNFKIFSDTSSPHKALTGRFVRDNESFTLAPDE